MNKIRNKEIEECINAIEYCLTQHGLTRLISPLNCIRHYIIELEHENFGNKKTIKNLQEKVEKYGGWLR